MHNSKFISVNRYFLSLLILWSVVSGYHDLYAQAPGGKNGRQLPPISERPKIGTLSGTVVSPEGAPLPFATISLFDAQNIDQLVDGTIADDKGKFLMTNIPAGIFKVKIQSMGFEEMMLDHPVKFFPKSSPEVKLGMVKLKEAVKELDGVTVEAEKELFVQSIDRQTYAVGSDLSAEGGVAQDVLQNIPMVEIDNDGNISLRGSENVRILINGKPSDLMGSDPATLMEQIPSNLIDKVEVITNPSVKFSPEGSAGIINVVLKKDKKGGAYGGVTASAGSYDNYGLSVNGNSYKGGLSLTGSYSFRQRNRLMDQTVDRVNLGAAGDTTSFLHQFANNNRGMKSHMFNLGAEYSFGKNVLGVSGGLNFSDRPSTNVLSSTVTDINGQQSSSNQVSTTDNNGLTTNLGLDYERKFDQAGRSLKATLSYSSTNETQHAYFGVRERNDLDIARENVNFQLDYVHPISSKWNAEMGWQSTYIENNQLTSVFTASGDSLAADPNRSNRFIYSEQINSIYGVMNGKLTDKWRMQAGLRVEQAHISADQVLESGTDKYPNDYFAFYPSIHMDYKLSEKNQLKASYSRRVSRPRGRQLNPFEDRSNELVIRKGNPTLSPSFTDSYEAGFTHQMNWGTLSSVAYYRHATNEISRITYREGDAVYNTYGNLATSQNAGIDVNLMARPTEWWRLMLGGSAYYQYMDPKSDSTLTIVEGMVYALNINSTFNLWKGASLQAMARYSSGREITNGERSHFLFSNVALKQKMLDGKLSATLKVNDPFDLMKFTISTWDPMYYQDMELNMLAQTVNLSLSYNFGKSNKKTSRKRQGNGESSGGGMEMDY
ncbi:TonB-dependent receptor (plasmid) [Persicobacter psychrovividus]|uniref:TonB-dependent receptor n=1 Tax=Persicobacter psychrovividus TaxID=387638 RepID=A0ABM7VMN8_9BACT|nr:TonB-dependent receptor [Persicobacter psychrovividus]